MSATATAVTPAAFFRAVLPPDCAARAGRALRQRRKRGQPREVVTVKHRLSLAVGGSE